MSTEQPQQESVGESNGYSDGETNAAGLKPFYSTPEGYPTIATEADLAHTIYDAQGSRYDNLRELDRYWAVFPYSYISVCQSKNHGELRYFVVEPYLSDSEREVLSYLIGKIQSKIRNYDTQILSSNDRHRRAVIREAAIGLLENYNMATGEVIRHAHADSEYITDEFEVNPSSRIEVALQRVLLGEEADFEVDPVDCARHAISCGATASYEYLHLLTRVDGHPLDVDADYDVETGDTLDDSSDGDSEAENGLSAQIGQYIEQIVQRFSGDSEADDVDSQGAEADSIPDGSEVEKPDFSANEWSDGENSDESADGDAEYRTDGKGLEPPSFAESFGNAAESEVGDAESVTPSDMSVVEEPQYYTDEQTLPPIEARFDAYDAALSSDAPENTTNLTTYQIYKILYYIERQFVGYKKIDAIKNDDQNVEDISVAGYDTPAYVYHKKYGQIRTNIQQTHDELDDFIQSLAQLSGEELSRRQPETDAKLPDGSRAELTLGYEISDTGSQYTIRQFKEVPHTPVDLINWETYGLDQMALLWLFVENGRSVMVAGGTGAGKTTTLNALSLFLPSNSRIVSIEDTPEIDLPHENWSAGKTREAGDLTDESVEIDEFDLLKQALRKRPDRIILGEIRGKEAFELFQSVRTGHPGLTTFHAPSFQDVVDRMTSEPIGVPTSLLTALDIVLIQGEKRVDGDNVRRNWSISEIEGYQRGFDNNGELTRKEVSEWDAETDTHKLVTDRSIQLEKVQEENGWSPQERNRQIRFRRVVLSALVVDEINTYKNVSAVLQAAILDPEQVLEQIAQKTLTENIESFTEDLLNINIDTDFGEENVDRPSPPEEVKRKAEQILNRSKQDGVLSEYV